MIDGRCEQQPVFAVQPLLVIAVPPRPNVAGDKVLETVDLPQVRPDSKSEADREIVETALGDGLVTGIERLKDVPAKSKVEQTVATAYLPKDSFHDAVKRLASAGELTVGWSPKALRTTEGRAVHLDVSERSLLGVLQGLADAFDLVCHTDGEKVIFTLPEEIPKARRDEARAASEGGRTDTPSSERKT